MASGTEPRPNSNRGATDNTPGTTYQIPSEVLSYSFILICFRRYGYFDSIVIPKHVITEGLTEFGINRIYNQNNITITISSSGLITLSGTGASELVIEVWGFN